jgi:hypothetical protein
MAKVLMLVPVLVVVTGVAVAVWQFVLRELYLHWRETRREKRLHRERMELAAYQALNLPAAINERGAAYPVQIHYNEEGTRER